MATALDLFLPLVEVACMGVPEPLAIQALRFSCIDFCRRTDLVQRIQPATDVVALTQDYTITVPTDMQLARVLVVTWQGFPLVEISPDDVQSGTALAGVTIGTSQVLTGSPRFYFQKAQGNATISLYPIPDTSLTGGLLIKSSFMPTPSATSVEDVLYNEWNEGIAAGAIARLKSIAGQPFSAPATEPRRVFEEAINAGKRQRIVGKQANFSRVQARRFT